MCQRRVLLSATMIALCATLLSAAPGGPGKKPPGPDTRDSYEQGEDLLAAKRYEGAIKLMQAFLKASPGDSRAEKAGKAIKDARSALAKQYAQEGREIDAATLYLLLAAEAEQAGEAKDSFVGLAVQTLMNAFQDAQKKHFYDKSLELEKAWGKLLPEKPGLLSAEELELMKQDAVVAACEDKFNQLALWDVLERHYGNRESSVPWDDLTKKNHGVPLLAAYFRALAEVGWAGRYIAEYQRLPADSPVRADKNFAVQTERVHLRWVEAAILQGNVRIARQTLSTARPEITSSSGLAMLKTMEAKLPPDLGDSISGKGEKKMPDLSFNEPITGKVTWNDKGEGYGEAKDVVLDDGCDVTVKAGTILNGGKITVKKAALHLKGTEMQPLIFRNVHVCIEIGGQMDADKALFINCTFQKTGGWVSMHSSRWTFNECLLYRSRFARLGQVEYGIAIFNCAIVESVLPARTVRGDDWAKAYVGKWDDISATLFLRTRLAPSVAWLSRGSNFVRCGVSAAGAGEEFASKTSLPVQLFVPQWDPFGWGLRSQTADVDAGEVQYGFMRKAFEVKVPWQLWALLPVELRDETQKRK